MRWIIRLVLAAALLAIAPASLAQTKRAFIVGVGDYTNLNRLTKTVGDAKGYAQVFKENLGFTVTTTPANPTRDQFDEAFGKFLETIAPSDEVVFIFSGHGWSDGAENYLALADAPKDASQFVLKSKTVALQQSVLLEIKKHSPGLIFAVIDACRDNPFNSGTRSGFEKGLVPIEPTQNTLVVYSAGAQQKALDRLSPEDDAPYSVFTRSLLPKLKDPNKPLMTSIDETRDEVQKLASSVSFSQRPAIYADVSLSFCFSGTCESTTKTPRAAAADCKGSWSAGGGRFALVIANGSYSGARLKPFPGAAADRIAMVRGLAAAGFSVKACSNLSLADMVQETTAFSDTLGEAVEAWKKKGGGPETRPSGFLYYSGLAAESFQRSEGNYLIPVDQDISSASQLHNMSVSLEDLAFGLVQTKPRAVFLIVDARRVALPGDGLKDDDDKMRPTFQVVDDMFVAFSPRPNQVGNDSNLFSEYLAEGLEKRPGDDVHLVFRDVRAKVVRQSEGRQDPSIWSTLVEKYNFQPPG